MKMTELFPSKYLRSSDLNGKSRIAVVDHVTYEAFQNDGRTETKAVLHFRGNGTKPFVVNKTNYMLLVSIAGSDDADDWAGTRITLAPCMVSFKGKVTESIRVDSAPEHLEAEEIEI
jgi:hypothetical protein